jgi:lysophospholipase L1-like esterase
MKGSQLTNVLISVVLFIATVVTINGFIPDSAQGFLSLESLRGPAICRPFALRIMPLGDSVTHGSAIPGGYRIELWQQFSGQDWLIDFVGSQENGPRSIDRDHEGHPGKAIQYFQQAVEGWFTRYRPQVVLLMVGTNNVLYPDVHDFPNATAHLNDLVQQITTTIPNAELLVAAIPPLADPVANVMVEQFNAAIPALVNAYVEQGQSVHYVDMYNALTPEDLADGVHPNREGYRKMATVWYDAIANIRNQRCQG